MRKILEKILKILAKIVLKKYKPVIIGVTGSVGKSSTKEAIYHILKSHFGENKIRRNQRNYNNEIGVPLTIFGLETGGRSIFKWFVRFFQIFAMIFFKKQYPDFLIIEMGADRPGDIKYLVDFIKPMAGVITAIGEIPVHLEFFNSPQQIAQEKRNLVSCLNENGIAVLNYDDEKVRAMGEGLKAKVITYGLNEKADIRSVYHEVKIDVEKNTSEFNFKIEYNGNSVPAKLIDVLGVQQLYSVLAATAVGIAFNMNLVEIVEAMKEFRPLPGRMRLIKGIKNTIIIDDTYNAALLSMEAALDSLKTFRQNLPAGRQGKIIVALGDMLEIGEYAPEAHKKIGVKASQSADLIFTIGARAKFIAEEAIKSNFPQDKIFSFMDSEEAGKEIQKQLKEGDIVLVKGSRGMKMEKIVKEIMAEPERAEELLVA